MFNEDVSNPDNGPDHGPDRGSPSGFQHEPMRPIQDGGGRAEIPRPRAVDVAFRASLASTAIASVATVVTVLLDRAWLERFARQMLAESGRPEADLSTGIAIAQVSLGIGILLFAGVFVLFALKMRAGRGWARVVLTLFAVLGAVNFLTAVANTGAELGLMWSLAEVAFSVTAVIYMFRPESTTYFAEHRKRRLARRGGQPRP